MRISDYFQLGRTQGALDFVDVDETADVRVFVDPRAIRTLPGDWGKSCAAMLTSFFAEILEAIHEGDARRLDELLGTLREPNETHLGFSRGRRSRGRGLGPEGSKELAASLRLSEASRAGLLQDIDDALLMVPGVGPDIISDVTTHVIRGGLIGYTRTWCEYFGIPLERQWSGPVWNPNSLEWQTDLVELPRTSSGRLLLVPRSIVRWKMTSDKDQYYNGYLAPLLEMDEIDRRTSIVSQRKSGAHFVLRDDLREKYPPDKLAIVQYTIQHPEALARYRNADSLAIRPLMDHEEFSTRLLTPQPDFDDLFQAIKAVSPGPHGAKAYHDAVEALLTAVFFPALTNPQVEKNLHQGRKRIDITYDNMAQAGFFKWMSLHHPAALIPVECKNFSGEPANPELDQISGRFSGQRGMVGILTVRQFQDKGLFLDRCRDTAKDGRGFIIPLDDDDLRAISEDAMAHHMAPGNMKLAYPLLRERYDFLVS